MFDKLKTGDHCEMAIQITDKFWNGKRNIALHIIHANKI